MYVLACEQHPDPMTGTCASGWLVQPQAQFLPPMSIDDAFLIGGSIVLLWITVYGVRAVIHLFHGR